MSSTRSSRNVWPGLSASGAGMARLMAVLVPVFLEAAYSSKRDEEQRAPLLLAHDELLVSICCAHVVYKATHLD